MIEITTNDIWTLYDSRPISRTWIGITTNGTVRKDGSLVMGRGIALQANQRIGGLARRLANHVRSDGNTIIMMHDLKMFTFPVKHYWYDSADLELIKSSAIDLLTLIDCPHHYENTFYLPRPGCGNGRLKWKDVKPILESVGLPDNIVVFSRPGEI